MSKPSTNQSLELFEHRWKSLRSAIRGRWPQITDEDLKLVRGDSRKLVALINQKSEMPLSEIEKAIDEIAASSGGLLTRVMHSADSMATSARRQVAKPIGRAYHQAQHQVADHLAISLSTAFCAGMLIGICFAAFHRE